MSYAPIACPFPPSFSLNAAGQVVLPDSVKNKIAQLNGEILLPLDGDYKNTSFFKNEEEAEPHWDVILSDRKHKREIRYMFLPDTSSSHFPRT